MGCGAPKRNHTTLWPKREKTVHSDRFLGLSLARQGNSKAHAGDDAAEGRVAVAQIAIHRVRRDCLVVIAGAASGSMLLGVEHDQALRIVDGERSRGHLVEQRKNGGIGADSEGHRDSTAMELKRGLRRSVRNE
jgi:hypothetical protein